MYSHWWSWICLVFIQLSFILGWLFPTEHYFPQSWKSRGGFASLGFLSSLFSLLFFLRDSLIIGLIIVFFSRASLLAQSVKNLPAMQETRVWSLGQEDPLEKEMATHSSIPAKIIPQTEEPGRLQSMGLQESDVT